MDPSTGKGDSVGIHDAISVPWPSPGSSHEPRPARPPIHEILAGSKEVCPGNASAPSPGSLSAGVGLPILYGGRARYIPKHEAKLTTSAAHEMASDSSMQVEWRLPLGFD